MAPQLALGCCCLQSWHGNILLSVFWHTPAGSFEGPSLGMGCWVTMPVRPQRAAQRPLSLTPTMASCQTLMKLDLTVLALDCQ